MKAKVISEKYQIYYRFEGQHVTEDVEYKDAYWRAFQVAGTLRCRVDVQRVTTVEVPEGLLNSMLSFVEGAQGKTAQIITGQVTIDANHFASDVNLSRYNGVNGWVVPEYINDFENAVFC